MIYILAIAHVAMVSILALISHLDEDKGDDKIISEISYDMTISRVDDLKSNVKIGLGREAAGEGGHIDPPPMTVFIGLSTSSWRILPSKPSS